MVEVIAGSSPQGTILEPLMEGDFSRRKLKIVAGIIVGQSFGTSILPYSALSGVAVKPSRNGPFTLPVDPPTPARLKDMGLDAGMSWDLGLEGHVEVLNVNDVVADIRDRTLPTS